VAKDIDDCYHTEELDCVRWARNLSLDKIVLTKNYFSRIKERLCFQSVEQNFLCGIERSASKTSMTQGYFYDPLEYLGTFNHVC
jgi:hypothetical protein